MCRYRLSPSALDKFGRVLGAEQYFESDLNYSEEDGYKQTLEEIVEAREKELLDTLNHAPQEPSIAAARGTAFNEVVDEMILYKYRPELTDLSKIADPSGRVVVTEITEETITATCEGFTFTYDRALVEEVAALMSQGTMQMHIQGVLNTEHGDVLLHGYPDYILPDHVTDLKTTESYKLGFDNHFGKYENYWQRYTYPYILRKVGLMERIDYFEFLIVEMKTDRNTGLITGTILKEAYTDVASQDKCEAELRWICEGFIQWIEDHRDQITNSKIFNQ